MRVRTWSFVVLCTLLVGSFGATQIESIAPAGAAPKLAWSVSSSGWERSSSPTIAGVLGNGQRQIVYGDENGLLHVVNPATGHDVKGWPRPVIVRGGATAVDGSPAVADLFGKGKKNIITPAGSTLVPNQNGGVVVFNANGSTHCRFRTADFFNVWTGNPHPDGYSEGVYSSPAIGDVNGDGRPDIVFGGWDLQIHAIDRNCHELPGFPFMAEDSTFSSPALYDVDGDGRSEIFIGSDQSPGGAIDVRGGQFRALRWTSGGVSELWRHDLNDVAASSPAIADIDGDRRPELVVGMGDYWHGSDSNKVFAWHLDDGSPLRGWPIAAGGVTTSSPGVGDLTGDRVPEVAVASRDGVVRAYRGNGQLLWARHLTTFRGAPGGPINGSPIVADLNGDGRNDVAVGNNFGFFVINGKNGAILDTLNTPFSYEASGAVGDFGPLGWRLVVVGFDTPHHVYRMQAFSIPKPKTRIVPWPMFRGGPTHVGGPVAKALFPPGICRPGSNPRRHPKAGSSHGYWVLGRDGSVYAVGGAPYRGGAQGRIGASSAVGIAGTASGKGYYVLSSDGAIHAFGDARSYGSMVGRALNAPIIALAPTPTGHGYWLLARDGGVFSFGDARFHGSTGNVHLNAPIISMAATRRGHGYWLLASDGGVFSFGDARFHGSTGNRRLNAPIISMATAPNGKGYWLIARDGGVFSFGVPFYGSIPGAGLCIQPAGTQIRPTKTGRGYYVLGGDGSVHPFGDAINRGSAPFLNLFNYAVDMSVRR